MKPLRTRHRNLAALVLAVIFTFVSFVSTSRTYARDPQPTVIDACKPVKKLFLSEAQMPSMKDRDLLIDCDSEQLYYGIGKVADPLMARHCALIEIEKNSERVFGGSAILMTIFANGIGAEQDYDLALHFACEIKGASGEVNRRIERLVKLKTEAVSKPNFHLCDDISSPQMKDHCKQHDVRIKKAKASPKAD